MKKSLLNITSLILVLMMALSAAGTTAFAAESDTVQDPDVAAVGGSEDSIADEGALDDVIVGSGSTTPVITAMEPCKEGIIIRWKEITGVTHFRIYKWFNDGRGWVKMQDTQQLYYIDSAVSSGTEYQYRLVGISAAGDVMTPTVAQSVTYYAPSHITAVQTVSNGISLSWNRDAAAAKVAVYRKNNGSWTRITTTAENSYTDTNVSYGNSYTYTVRPLKSNGDFLFDFYDNTGVTHAYLQAPTFSVTNAAGGVKISWSKVAGAAQYRVFYRNSAGNWARLTTTAGTSYLDKNVTSGKSYTYTIRCTSADGESYTSYFNITGKRVAYVAAPVLVSASGEGNAIRITWKKSEGASKYRVFYRNGKGQWTKLGDTAGTSMLDTDVKSGVTYTYTVRCLDASGAYCSSYDDAGIKGMFLDAPTVTVAGGVDGVNVTWKAVSGAVNYRVYVYGAAGWVKLADTNGTSYTDTNVTSGNKYAYTVRCINADGTAFTSSYNAGKSITYVAAPKLSLKCTSSGVSLSWSASKGTAKYRVYYYGSNGWTKMADTTATSYLDKDVSSGHTYTYTVRCINSAGTAFQSAFRPGVAVTYCTAPDFTLTPHGKSITVSWKKVDGAELYRVYLKGANGWTKVTDTTETSYVNNEVVYGTTYTYTVRCLNADATMFTSDYHAGKSIRIVETPHVKSAANTTQGVEVKWDAVAGAVKYRVYYKTDSGWTKAGETADTAFMHTAAESGKDYTYTVRCVNADGTAFESDFDTTGKSVHYIASPKNLKAESKGNSVRISWTHSAGAAKYRVYYYGSKGWTKLTETADNAIIDADVASGKTYRYTVRCISADGKSFTSDYDADGVSYLYTTVPVLHALDYTKSGIEVSWKASTGAQKYRVYRYGMNGWTKLTDTTATSYEDTGVASGNTYRYTVRCLTSNAKSFTSDYDATGVKAYYVAAPKLQSADTGSGTVKLTWSKPNGASYYRVYKKVSGSWKRLTTTSSNTYTDKDVSVGSTYTYTVRVVNADGSAFYSGFDPDGFIVTVIKSTSQFVYYDQGQYNYPYGDDTIAYSGCGPTSFAMIASTLTGRSITPIDAVKWCGNSYYVYNVGTMWSYFYDAADYFGIKMEKQLGSDEFSKVVTALKQGKYVISAQRAGIFTRGGHFIVLAGITSTGKIIVYDPNGGNHYIGTQFAQSDITASGTQYWVFDK